MEKHGTARHTTYDNIIWRMRFACYIAKTTHTHTHTLTHVTFIRALRVLLHNMFLFTQIKHAFAQTADLVNTILVIT